MVSHEGRFCPYRNTCDTGFGILRSHFHGWGRECCQQLSKEDMEARRFQRWASYVRVSRRQQIQVHHVRMLEVPACHIAVSIEAQFHQEPQEILPVDSPRFRRRQLWGGNGCTKPQVCGRLLWCNWATTETKETLRDNATLAAYDHQFQFKLVGLWDNGLGLLSSFGSAFCFLHVSVCSLHCTCTQLWFWGLVIFGSPFSGSPILSCLSFMFCRFHFCIQCWQHVISSDHVYTRDGSIKQSV